MGVLDGEVNRDKGIIKGVSVCTVGEAKGHGVNLDHEFIGRVADLGNEKKQGLKARFGHPNMCSTALGTFIGRFKNFRVNGDQVISDLFLSNEAKETPHGNLYDYVLGMAENEPDMFGTSIVFTPGRTYQRAEDGSKEIVSQWESDDERPVFVECDALHACDTVDEPAANNGLFSAFAGETIAGQITTFLDDHPEVWEAMQSNPSILEALTRHGGKVDEFMNRYRDYREHNGKGNKMSDETATSAELLEEAGVTEPSATETPAVEEAETETPQETPAEIEAPEVDDSVETPAAELSAEPVTVESFDRAEFTRIADEFGGDIAVQTVRDGGSYETAQGLFLAQLKADNEALRKQNDELSAAKCGTPAKVTEKKEVKGLFKTGK